jgi:tRNA(Ile)-lysidine synthase
VRHALLPMLATRAGDGVVDVLARTAETAREDEELLASLAAQAFERLVTVRDGAATAATDDLLAEPQAIGRRVVKLAAKAGSDRILSWTHVATLLSFAQSGRPGIVRAGGCELELSGAARVLSFRAPRPLTAPAALPSRELPVPGSVELPEAGLRLRAARQAVDAMGGFDAATVDQPLRAVIAGPDVGPALLVRGWRPGDTLQPMGLSGRKKVQDLFVDRKVPRAHRRAVPIVTAPDGRIVWVAGYALGEPFRVTPATKSVVVLSFEPLGGP